MWFILYIVRSLFDRYAAGKATHIPSCSKPNITFDLFYLQKNIIFMYCIFRYILPKFIKKDFVVLNLNLLLIPKALPIFFYFGFCKNIVCNKTYQCSKCKLEHYFSRFLTVSYVIELTGKNYYHTSMNFWRIIFRSYT